MTDNGVTASAPGDALTDAVEQAFAWIASVAEPAEGGPVWTEDGERYDDLYAGTAGVLLGCAEAAAAGRPLTAGGVSSAGSELAAAASTGTDLAGSASAGTDLAGLASAGLASAGLASAGLASAGLASAGTATVGAAAVAAGARDRLVHLAQHEPDAATMPDDGLFTGWAGAALALRAWANATGDRAALDAATAISARIADRILRRPDDPARYTDVISGDAGILLALLHTGTGLHNQTGLQGGIVAEAALHLSDGLLAMAEDRPDGLHWWMHAGTERLMPGFSHGTAGVAYALAAAGTALKRDDLVDVAVRAADGLIALADRPGGWALPLLVPPQPGRPPVNYGWCHGPTGTLRLFTLLNEIDPQPRWTHALDACLRALRDSRLPERLYPGYWDNVARCCGTAGVGKMLVDRYQATGDPDLLSWSGALAADVLARRTPREPGIAWSNTEHTAIPPDLPPEPGFMQGAAGIAGWLALLARPGTKPLVPWL